MTGVRGVLSFLGLLLVLYIVMQLARTQLQALRPALPAKPVAGASAATPQQQVVDELNKALEIGRQRAASAAD
ncbi:MAG: hypothetical protein IT500_16050 [Rubrivivax sp.]|nr:hypothetical protein [Rubrivivax sp.]